MQRILQFFEYEHLPEHLQEPSKACAELARKMDAMCGDEIEPGQEIAATTDGKWAHASFDEDDCWEGEG